MLRDRFRLKGDRDFGDSVISSDEEETRNWSSWVYQRRNEIEIEITDLGISQGISKGDTIGFDLKDKGRRNLVEIRWLEGEITKANLTREALMSDRRGYGKLIWEFDILQQLFTFGESKVGLQEVLRIGDLNGQGDGNEIICRSWEINRDYTNQYALKEIVAPFIKTIKGTQWLFIFSRRLWVVVYLWQRFSRSVWLGDRLVVWFFIPRRRMAHVAVNKIEVVRTEVVKIASLDVERRIKQFELTLIGRVWNPMFQNMDSLLHNMPKFWRLEDKVTGADLEDGKFHFNFRSEEDIQEYAAAGSLWVVGKLLGKASDVDEDSGYIRVTLNGFKPLVFTTIIPFDNGHEVTVTIDYEKLANHCKHCFRLTHLASVCPELCEQVDKGRLKRRITNRQQSHTLVSMGRMAGRWLGRNRHGQEFHKGASWDGRMIRKDSSRIGAWESQARGNKQVENVYRVKDGRPHSYDRGRNASWPTPLYHVQKGGYWPIH
ncbi:unnamed protein product [Arabis nemorensis]|uniref:Zinc knuckle CX2CX4HX4C domain-containing protein n=1 Tax=Arabis nemorensis TaxID=586526 RepID=A0A565C4Y4_9BRAS|nr:unnamed protein product [Arabis nemorensis]